MRQLLKPFLALLLLVGLAACGDGGDRIKIGAKNFGESRVLAHMMAALAQEQGLPVAGVIDYDSTPAIMEALKRGDIDAYPEYNGTGLVMLGQNPTADGAEATERVRALYEPLGFSWRAKMGFANNYGLAMRAERAQELEISTISELVSQAPQLVFGVEDDFVVRPLDGLQALQRRYGLDFAATEVVPLSDRALLYDQLLDGDLDVIEVFTTDGQIADYGLVLLRDDLEFFPVYEASPLARAASLSAHPGFGAALDALDGKIDSDLMQDLNRKVDIEGRSPEAVARDALARMGLLQSGAVVVEEPLLIAASPYVGEGAAASAALRAARSAFVGRDVQIDPTHTPLDRVASGDARLALVGADAFFDTSGPAPTRDERFEAVAVIGQNLIHLVTPQFGPTNLSEAQSILVGPEGSSSYRIGSLLKDGLNLDAALVPGDGDSTADLVGRLDPEGQEVAVVFAPQGDRALVDAFGDGGHRLLKVDGWSEGANLVRFPFLREARISPDVYRGQVGAIDTLGSQLVLAGPAEVSGDAVGDQGPSSIAVGLSPISGAAVRTLSASVAGAPFIDPALKQAPALAPELPSPPAAINPSPYISILSLIVVILLVWLAYLYVRPEVR
ncbi:MAG: glycine betaine ABC transporter substrate-binding protein [Pseudomonadota bacterium]